MSLILPKHLYGVTAEAGEIEWTPRFKEGCLENRGGIGEVGWDREPGLRWGTNFVAGVRRRGDRSIGKYWEGKTEGAKVQRSGGWGTSWGTRRGRCNRGCGRRKWWLFSGCVLCRNRSKIDWLSNCFFFFWNFLNKFVSGTEICIFGGCPARRFVFWRSGLILIPPLRLGVPSPSDESKKLMY